MKRILLSLLFIAIPLFSKIDIAVSIPPQVYILEKIAPNLVDTTLVVKPGNSPHTYEPKASEMVAISKDKLYFAIGVEFENVWLPKFKAQNSSLKIIRADANITKIAISSKDKNGRKDPHIWLSPKNLKIIAQNMANALIKEDKNNAQIYKKSLNNFLKKLDILDKSIKEKLTNLKNRNFLVVHPSWGYFAKDYNLNQIAIEVSGKEPSAKELIKIVKFAKEKNVKAIFVQPEFSTKSAKLIAQELNIGVIKISPLTKDVVKNLEKFTNVLAGKNEN